jgi:hypothetical protein
VSRSALPNKTLSSPNSTVKPPLDMRFKSNKIKMLDGRITRHLVLKPSAAQLKLKSLNISKNKLQSRPLPTNRGSKAPIQLK